MFELTKAADGRQARIRHRVIEKFPVRYAQRSQLPHVGERGGKRLALYRRQFVDFEFQRLETLQLTQGLDDFGSQLCDRQGKILQVGQAM